jgi:CheY-like chemotaxis protein
LVTQGSEVRLNFSVRDTGIGIAPEDVATIFKPFEQVGSTDRRAGGTGLGLSITRQLIEMMGSELKLESTAGAGSLFWFDVTLPITHVQPASSDRARDCSGYRGTRKTVLVVDDITANREVMVAMLAELGFVVEQAPDARSGITQALDNPPDLVLMDIRMPGMDGLEAICVLRGNQRFDAVPIMAVSSGISAENQARALEAGACSFLPKPLDRAELVRLVGEALAVDWIVEEEAPAAQEQAMLHPRPDELAALHAAAMAGNMRQVRAEADKLASGQAAYRPFADAVTTMARAFQSQALLALIESAMEQQP